MEKTADAFRTISEVAGDLDLPQHVLRFWESRFTQIRPLKRGGGRRYYRREDIELLRAIRQLLYGEGYTINLPVPAGSGEDLWLSLIEHIVLPAAASFEPDLVLVSAGFDAHVEDPLGGCRLQTGSFAEMARHVRDMAKTAGAPVGAILEGGYDASALALSVKETLAALSGGQPARSNAPEALFTSRAAAQIGRYWPL